MIFPNCHQKVLSGEKKFTYRLQWAGDSLGICDGNPAVYKAFPFDNPSTRWVVGRVYAIQRWWRDRAVGHIRITKIEAVDRTERSDKPSWKISFELAPEKRKVMKKKMRDRNSLFNEVTI